MRLSMSSQFKSAARAAGADASNPAVSRSSQEQADLLRARSKHIFSTVPRSVECGWRMTNDTTPPLPPASPALIDIGINLSHDSYDGDRDAVIARAEASGVVQMMVTGASIDGAQKALELARSRPGRLFATAGVHPHHATD